jgi:hypothetical protein
MPHSHIKLEELLVDHFDEILRMFGLPPELVGPRVPENDTYRALQEVRFGGLSYPSGMSLADFLSVSQSPFKKARTAIGLGLSAQQYVDSLMSNAEPD